MFCFCVDYIFHELVVNGKEERVGVKIEGKVDKFSIIIYKY